MGEAEIDHEFTDLIVCPYCGYEEPDSWEVGSGEFDCQKCEKTFRVEVDVTVTYSTKKVEATQ